MNKHLIHRMTDELNAYVGKMAPGSAEQVAATKTLGLIVWFMFEFARVRKVDECPRDAVARLWESIMVHADDYLSAESLDTIYMVQMIMSTYKAPAE